MLSSLSVSIQPIYKLYLIRDQAISLALLELPGDKYCSKIWFFMTVILPDSTTGSHTVESTNAHKGALMGTEVNGRTGLRKWAPELILSSAVL